VIQNHLFQIVALLAMEPPAGRDYGAVHTEKAKVFQAMRPLKPDDLVRGQYAGYRKEPDVAKSSDVETFCALRLFIDSWRWEGVPWYLRSGKYLAETASEVLVELKPPPQRLFADSAPTTGRANYLRFRLSPSEAVALAARVKLAGRSSSGTSESSTCSKNGRQRNRPTSGFWATPWPAMERSSPVKTRSRPPGAVVDPVLKAHQRARPYKRGTWGPKEADRIIAPDGCWHNPEPKRQPKDEPAAAVFLPALIAAGQPHFSPRVLKGGARAQHRGHHDFGGALQVAGKTFESCYSNPTLRSRYSGVALRISMDAPVKLWSAAACCRFCRGQLAGWEGCVRG